MQMHVCKLLQRRQCALPSYPFMGRIKNRNSIKNSLITCLQQMKQVLLRCLLQVMSLIQIVAVNLGIGCDPGQIAAQFV